VVHSAATTNQYVYFSNSRIIEIGAGYLIPVVYVFKLTFMYKNIRGLRVEAQNLKSVLHAASKTSIFIVFKNDYF
jgi:hypothetical protein